MTRQLTFFKLGIMTAAATLALPLGSAVASAVLVGAAIGFVANHAFARRVFAPGGSTGAALAATFYRAEVARLLTVGVLFSVLFALAPALNVPALLAGFLAVHLGTSVAALILDPSPDKGTS